MSEKSLIRQSVEYNYRFQKCMYFNGRKKINGAIIFFSNYIEDFFWNFAIDIYVDTVSVPMFIKNVEKEMNSINRRPAFYMTPWTEPFDLLLQNLLDQGYQRKFEDRWMFFTKGFHGATIDESIYDFTIEVVSSKSGMEDFFDVYSKVYADEPTAEEPSGILPLAYITALRQSFLHSDADAFHLVGYKSSRPIAIATLVCADGWGGIYNIGTLPDHRHQGIGSLISQACVNKWEELGGHVLFLQTEDGVRGEKFYSRLGFKTEFICECWAK